jgi:hypothetical protein
MCGLAQPEEYAALLLIFASGLDGREGHKTSADRRQPTQHWIAWTQEPCSKAPPGIVNRPAHALDYEANLFMDSLLRRNAGRVEKRDTRDEYAEGLATHREL